jgi:hypothetical protein
VESKRKRGRISRDSIEIVEESARESVRNVRDRSARREQECVVQEARDRLDWQSVDHALRRIAKCRSMLDVEEARWLREAERMQIWKPLGMVSMLDYCERVLAYTPHVASERMRVARALAELPLIEDAFAHGTLAFSAVRELTRVATAETERRWLDRATGKTVREVEELVSGHDHGDDPDDPPDPEAKLHALRWLLPADVYARYRQAVTTLSNDHGRHLEPPEIVTAFCDAVLDRAANTTEPTGRAKFQIALKVCSACDRASQEGGGTVIPIDGTALERARCDAQHIGSLDGEAPERASQDIPPSVVRFVWSRDAGRCQTPGCRSSVGLEIHHVVPRADGGGHEPSNLRLACSSCHMGFHAGTLTLDGRRPNAPCAHTVEETPVLAEARDALVGLGWKRSTARAAVHAAASHVGLGAPLETVIREALQCRGPRDEQPAVMRGEARDALVGMGWSGPIARAAVDAAASHVGTGATLEMLIREALRRCMKPI